MRPIDADERSDELDDARETTWTYVRSLDVYECSRCGKLYLPYAEVYNYCPQCGRMITERTER